MARKRKHTKRPAKGYMLADIKPTEPASLKAHSTSEDKPFRLFDLPDELVLVVLELVVVISSKDDPIDINLAVRRKRQRPKPALSGPTYRRGTSRLVQPVVARTCRMLRCEGLKLFYGRNCFYGDAFEYLGPKETPLGIPELRRWFRCVGPAHSSKINQLYLAVDDDDPCVCQLVADLAELLTLPGCQVARLRCDRTGLSLVYTSFHICYHMRLDCSLDHPAESEWRALDDVVGSAKMLLEKDVERGHQPHSEVWQETLASWPSASASTSSGAQDWKS